MRGKKPFWRTLIFWLQTAPTHKGAFVQKHQTPLYPVGTSVLLIDTQQTSKLKPGIVTVKACYQFSQDDTYAYFVYQGPFYWNEDWITEAGLAPADW